MKYLYPRHRCWWCKELFEECEMVHEKSGWLCKKCHDYLKTQEVKMVYIITILDYCLNEVRVYHFNKANKPKDPEAWIKKHDKNWSDDQCYWMGGDNTRICYMGGDNTRICYMDRDTGEYLVEDLI